MGGVGEGRGRGGGRRRVKKKDGVIGKVFSYHMT
jgi:hypothetical protein